MYDGLPTSPAFATGLPIEDTSVKYYCSGYCECKIHDVMMPASVQQCCCVGRKISIVQYHIIISYLCRNASSCWGRMERLEMAREMTTKTSKNRLTLNDMCNTSISSILILPLMKHQGTGHHNSDNVEEKHLVQKKVLGMEEDIAQLSQCPWKVQST